MGTHYQGTTAEQRALDTYIKLMRAAESVTSRVNQHLTDNRLTVSQFGVLEALLHLGPMNQGVLGEKILKSSGNMTLVIDNLEKRHLVHRDRNENDRRCITVSLTNEGEALIRSIFPAHVAQITEQLQVLSPEEQQRLGQLAKKLGLQKRTSGSCLQGAGTEN